MLTILNRRELLVTQRPGRLRLLEKEKQVRVWG